MATLVKRKRQSDYKSDAEYMLAAKDPNHPEHTTSMYELYTKYLPLIRKHATKFQLDVEDREDYEMDAYFCVSKVVDYVQLDKIDERFSFGYFLRLQLLNQGIDRIKKNKRQTEKMGSKISYEAVTDNGFTPDALIASDDDILEDIYRESDMAAVLKEINNLPIKARDRRIGRDILLGATSTETATRERLSTQRVKTIQKGVVEQLKARF